MSNETDNKSQDLNARVRQQIDLQQTEEALRRVKNEIINLDIQIRKNQQEYTRAKMNLDSAEARLKILQGEEFDLNQKAMRQKRAYITKQ